MTTVWLEVDLYSGRPNPAGKLSAAKWGSLMELLATLASRTPLPLPDKLGYRGLLVTYQTPTEPPIVLHIYQGTIRRQEGTEIIYLTDPEKQAVRLLLDAAKHWLDDETARRIAAEEQLS